MAKKPLRIDLPSIQERIDIFCEKEIPNCPCKHVAETRGKFIYLRRLFADNQMVNLGRLTYEGDLENMEFALYKLSSDKYSVTKIFPGSEYIDGTIEGAIKAGLAAYPLPIETKSNRSFLKSFLRLFGLYR